MKSDKRVVATKDVAPVNPEGRKFIKTTGALAAAGALSTLAPAFVRNARSSSGSLLLDEPLSALDLNLRQHMCHELRAIQKRTGVTFLYITHDQLAKRNDNIQVLHKHPEVALPQGI